MLRLELKDVNETVLFVNPVNGICIHKLFESYIAFDGEKHGIRVEFATCGSCELMHTAVWYPDPESRDAAYEYVLAKINEYLFPQIEEVRL